MSTNDRIAACGTCAATVIYMILGITAIISIFSPFLTKLASHGKTRVLLLEARGQDDDHANISSSSMVFMVWKFLDHPLLQIPKMRFASFYSIGLVCSAYMLWDSCEKWASTLLCIHLARRYVECRCVHKWHGTMHLAGYALGLLHYFLLPFMFKSHYDIRLSWPGCIVGVSLNVYAQYNQYLHHFILGNYRSLSHREKGQRYFIPFGHWFDYVSCPHYLAEILIYASFAILLHPSVHDDDNDADGVGVVVVVCDANRWSAEICSLILPWRHVVLLLWVAINLAVSARSSHGWYQNQFKAYPKNRCALIPFLW